VKEVIMAAVIRLRLTREEIHVLMQMAQLPGMMGVEPFVPSPEGEALFGLALRTLITRGMVELNNEGQFVVDQTVVGIIAASAGPDVMAMINTRTSSFDITTTFPIQLKPGLLIAHQADQGMHTFEVYEDVREIAEQAVLALRIPQEIAAIDVKPLRVRSTTMDAAREVRTQGAQAILRALMQDQGDAAAFQMLAETLANSTYNTSFSMLRSISEQIDGFAVIASNQRCYMVTPDKDPNSPWLTIASTSTQEIRRRVHGACLTVL
jgi:hypothetical protein